MKKRTMMLSWLAILLVFLFTTLSVYSQEDVEAVDDSAFEKKMRPAVGFLHDDHNDMAEIEDCQVCHHVYADGQLVEDDSSEDQECSECHVPDGDTGRMPLVRVYHLRCKGCHLEQKAGPVMCAECHKQ